MDSDDGLNFEGAWAIMLDGGFGFQIDGMHSSIGSTEFIGGGAQVFWQHASPWLAGLGFARVHGEFVNTHEISTDLRFQQSRYSVGAKIGFAEIDYRNQVPFIDDNPSGLLAEIYADFYASDTLRASFGVEHRFDLFFGKVEVEWLSPIDGLSLFANCMAGEHGYDHALVGLRYWFGGEAGSLKGRRNTPRPLSSGTLYGIGNHGAFYNDQAKRFLVKNQGTQAVGGSGHYGGTVTINNPPPLTTIPGTLLPPGFTPPTVLVPSTTLVIGGGGITSPAP